MEKHLVSQKYRGLIVKVTLLLLAKRTCAKLEKFFRMKAASASRSVPCAQGAYINLVSVWVVRFANQLQYANERHTLVQLGKGERNYPRSTYTLLHVLDR